MSSQLMNDALVLHPGLIALLSPLGLSCTIALVDSSCRLQRASFYLLSIAIAAQLQYSIPAFTGNGTYDGAFMSYIWILHLRAFDLLFCEAVYLSAAMPSPSLIATIQSTLSRLVAAWCLLFNLRNINRPRRVKNLPAWSSRHPEYVPEKSEFVKRRLLHILTTYLMLDAIFALLPAPNPVEDVPEHKQPLLSRMGDITLEEIIARPITVILPAFSIYGMFTIPYNIAASFTVLFCGGKPQHWPPIFGSLPDAYTLRRFWGKFWHQLLRSSLEACTSFLITCVFGISSHHKTLIRYLRVFLAFYITALIHIPGVVVLGGSPFASGCPTFFIMQAVGILIESMVIYLWSAISRTPIDNMPTRRMTKVLGYVWVLAWTSWTGPSFTWVIARALVQGRDDVVPWSFIKWLGNGKP
ncbi:hypothetical protein BP6252_10778 [Coleophoma cylindrospora]|uniref:Wax synthase domain-containing protein n=1 Tax=Coleophoma cylindrospora TaxID=1849047 RepID=A0A3D8QTM7_9HELO|nr:hypothetical protein BP6252_10778 [Coleophoma cylindrospora]